MYAPIWLTLMVSIYLLPKRTNFLRSDYNVSLFLFFGYLPNGTFLTTSSFNYVFPFSSFYLQVMTGIAGDIAMHMQPLPSFLVARFS